MPLLKGLSASYYVPIILCIMTSMAAAPLTITASIVSVTVKTLHGLRLFLDDH